MANTRAKRHLTDLVIKSTDYGRLMEVAVKDNFKISETTEGYLSIFECEGLAACVTRHSNRLLGRYEGFGTADGEKYIKLRVIGNPGQLEIRKSQIESITLYKGREYKF